MAGRAAVFLDRDGVLNWEAGDYITRPDDLLILPGAAESLARLTAVGWPVFVFTNQAGVGRGRLTEQTLTAIHDRLRAELEAGGGRIEAIYACIHHPDAGCDCRKPRPGLLLQAAREHSLDLTRSFVVGDSPRDIAAGAEAGCHTVLVLTGHTSLYEASTFPDPQPDYIFPTLADCTALLFE